MEVASNERAWFCNGITIKSTKTRTLRAACFLTHRHAHSTLCDSSRIFSSDFRLRFESIGFKMESTELIPALPDDLGVECLTRLPPSAYRFALRVCRQWCRLLESDEFYHYRKKSGHTRRVACLVQAHPHPHPHPTDQVADGDGPKPTPSYGITVFDPLTLSWEHLDPVPECPFGLPLFCQPVSCERKLVLVGGWDPASYEPVPRLFIYDFRTSRWRRGKDMPSKRSFFAIGAYQGRVYVAGGHDENKNALKAAWVYDLRRDEWTELSPMSQERDECEGMVVDDEFWVVSGYTTERQGLFDPSVEALGFGSGQWRRIEGAWEAGGCPRSCVGLGKDGKLVKWVDLESGVRVRVCGVTLGSQTLVIGSEYQGAPIGFYLLELEGQNRKLDRISVPRDFSGLVQSACCVEI